MSKIALGTVQFGMPYGVANKSGQVQEKQVGEILEYAESQGIDTLDTAIGYGESERVLGKFPLGKWKVVSKLGRVPDGTVNVCKWVTEQIHGSLDQLRIPSMHSLLLHDPSQLTGNIGHELFSALRMAKEKNLVQEIGISIYESSELDRIFETFSFDIVQAPFHIADHRLIKTGWLDRLQDLGVEFHARSVFLQGLLLLGSNERPSKFQRWDYFWSAWQHWLDEVDLSPLEACLRYVHSFSGVRKVIVGVDSSAQLREICKAVEGDMPNIPDELYCDDLDFLNPSRWSSL